MDVILAVAGALIILLGVIALAAGAGMLKAPGTDFFAFLGNMFGFLERQVGLAGKETADMFCEKPLQEAIDMCKMKPSQLSDYCDAEELEQAGICQKPPTEMKKFCEQLLSDRIKMCRDQNGFNSACDAVNTAKKITTMKDMPFCK